MLGVAGCRDNGAVSPVDLSMAGGGGGGTGGGMDMATTMKNYTVATVAAMRQGAPGDYELDDVIAIGLTPSTASPHLFVQDAAGGDYTAIVANCSSSSMTHPCTVASTVKTVAIGHKVTLKGTYIKASLANGGSENFYIDAITDNGAGTLPAPLTMDETGIARGAKDAKKIFQSVTVTPVDDLVMYDWTPSELKYSGTWPGCTTAPFVFGFGMVPATGAPAMGAACTVKTMQPAGQATPPANEVLIGTDFYKNFEVSSDCQCSGAHAGVTVPATATKWPKTVAMTGILIYDVPFGMTTGYQYCAPQPTTAGAGALTGTVTPPM
ncbi:MAG: hypothetical protein ACXVAN_08325 [Polyangia bacterium]